MIKNYLGGVKRTQRRVRALARLEAQLASINKLQSQYKDELKKLKEINSKNVMERRIILDTKQKIEFLECILESNFKSIPRITKEIETLKTRI